MGQWNKCQFSNEEVALHIDPSIPVECPKCGAIRKIPTKSIYSDSFTFPNHEEPDGSRLRKRYKKQNGIWSIVEE